MIDQQIKPTDFDEQFLSIGSLESPTEITLINFEDQLRNKAEVPAADDMAMEKLYKEKGFFCAVDPETEPLLGFGRLKEKIFLELQEDLASLDEYSAGELKRFQLKVDCIVDDLSRSHQKLESHENSTIALEKMIVEKQDEVRFLKMELEDKFEELFLERKGYFKDRIKNRLDELHAELEAMLKNHLILAKSENDLNKQIFKDEFNQVSNAKRMDRFENFREETRRRLKSLQPKTDLLNSLGITLSTSRYLTASGYILILAAGWFFSTFWSERGLSEPDLLSQSISNLFNFFHAFFYEDLGYAGPSFLLKQLFISIFILFAVLLIASLFIWIFQLLLDFSAKKLRGKKSKILIGIGKDDSISYLELDPQSYKTLLLSWLYFVPYIFVAGLAIIILALSSQNPSSPDGFILKTSSELYGTGIALAISGFMYLYVSYIIEPRWSKLTLTVLEERSDSTLELWKMNWELGILAIVFFCSFFLLFWQADAAAISFIQFIISSLFAGIVYAYGLKFNGLIEKLGKLELKLNNLGRAIEKESRPKMLDMHAFRNRPFRKLYNSWQSELMEMIRTQNRYDSKVAQNRFGKKLELKDVKLLFNEIDGTLFPEKFHSIELTTENLATANQKLSELETQKEDLLLEQTELYRLLRNRIDRLKQGRNDLLKVINAFAKQAAIERRKRQETWDLKEQWMRDGFDLGLWYRANVLASH